ncbi:MAG TPA: serine/threonine-protein kinase [Kofleriaceae bacterium]|nr:serine/threonine-protein kinase [Kofleriaceae bacterium]
MHSLGGWQVDDGAVPRATPPERVDRPAAAPALAGWPARGCALGSDPGPDHGQAPASMVLLHGACETLDFDHGASAGRGDSTITVRAASSAEVGREHGLAVGELVGGRYRILRFIARGAVGEVYAAFDEDLGSTVALKALRAERVRDGLSLCRFRREVLLTRALAHPGVCRIFDLGAHESPSGERIPFLTMELLAGETLASRLERGPLGLDHALALAEKLASAVGAAHAAGIIHRDLKPANIMLVPDASARGGERVVIMDFGLARRIAAGQVEGNRGGGRGEGGTGRAGGGGGGEGEADPVRLGGEGDDARATATGALVGSPAYMAPEQVAGLALGPGADIYSLGVVLFEAVTGRLPFEADSLIALISARLERDAPAAGGVRPGLDARWDDAIARCLDRDPARRFARAEDVPRAIAAGLEGVGPAARRRWPGRHGWRRPAAAAAAGVALALAVALFGAPAGRQAGSASGESVIASRR